MLLFFAVIAALATSVPDDPAPVVEFSRGSTVPFTATKPRLVVTDDLGVPLFAARPELMLREPDLAGRIWAWDQTGARVRVTPPDRAGWWVSCDDITAPAPACGNSLRVAGDRIVVGERKAAVTQTRGFSIRRIGPLSGLPLCPGDQRCPKLR